MTAEGRAAYEAWWRTAEGVPASPDVTYNQDADAWDASAQAAISAGTATFHDGAVIAGLETSRGHARARREQAAEALAAGENGTSKKVRKKIVGERAIERLIELHRDEFSRFFDEEYAALDIPDDVRARVATLVRAGLSLRSAEAFVRASWPCGEIAPGIWISAEETPHAQA